MNVHKNARLTPLGRERIVRQVESGQTPEAVSETAGVCPRTVRKWVERLSSRRVGRVARSLIPAALSRAKATTTRSSYCKTPAAVAQLTFSRGATRSSATAIMFALRAYSKPSIIKTGPYSIIK